MRNAVLILIILLGLTGCNKTDKTSVSNPSLDKSPEKCIDLSGYKTLTNVDDKAEWLRNNGDRVCEKTLFDEILNTHNLKTATVVYSIGAKAINISWKDFKTFIGSTFYNAYLSFAYDNNKQLDHLVLIQQYDKNNTCYSIPLFLAINNNNPMKDDDMIEFKQGSVNGVQTIIFIIKNEAFNISNEPLTGKTNIKSPYFKGKK